MSEPERDGLRLDAREQAPASSGRADVGLVAIGRNEGDRLKRCLRSALPSADCVVYVDSGSQDDSVEFAKRVGAEVVVLDTATGFTAARARNAGLARLLERRPDVRYVQMVDGDCELDPAWIAAAAAFLDRTPRAAVACGRRRERFPEASIYNELCDLEWDTPPGEASSCGGDALFRTSALKAVHGYDARLIAGEEPELCVRLRQAGWTVHRLPLEMTLHDAAITKLSQCWRRAVRAGHAFAEGAALHGAPPERHGVRETRSSVAWGVVVPALALGFAWWSRGVTIGVWALVLIVQTARLRLHELRRGRPRRAAALLAVYYVASKLPQAQGAIRYWMRRLSRRPPTLIEYKGVADGRPGRA